MINIVKAVQTCNHKQVIMIEVPYSDEWPS